MHGDTAGVGDTMEVLALTAALAVAGSPSLWAISMADMGATSTGMDSFRPTSKPVHQVRRHQEQAAMLLLVDSCGKHAITVLSRAMHGARVTHTGVEARLSCH